MRRRELQEEEKNFQLSAARIRGILSKLAIAHAKYESRLEKTDGEMKINQCTFCEKGKGSRSSYTFFARNHYQFLCDQIGVTPLYHPTRKVLVPTSHIQIFKMVLSSWTVLTS